MKKPNLCGIVLRQRSNLVFVYTDGKKRVALDYEDFSEASRNLDCLQPWLCGVFVNSKKPTGFFRYRTSRLYPRPETKRLFGFPEGAFSYQGENTGVGKHRAEYKHKLQSILKKAKEFIAAGIDKKAALIAARKCSCQVH